MTHKSYYKIGGHLFVFDSSDAPLSEMELKPYAPFQTEFSMGEKPLFSLTLLKEACLIPKLGAKTVELKDENGPMVFYQASNGDHTIFLYTPEGNECCKLAITGDYSYAKAWIGGSVGERRYALDTALMLLYTFASSKRQTLMLHASVIENEGRGYLFLGKSGTGKSTHSRLWIENIKGSKLLNDDNPIIRILDGIPYVFGSPWSGKTPCYKNQKLPISGIVRLQQSPYNRIGRLSGIASYAALLPSCSCMKWDQDMADDIHDSVCKVISEIPIYRLECLADKNAANLCFENLRKGAKYD